MKRVLFLLSIVTVVCLPSLAQDQPRWEFFGGYTFGRLDTHDTQNAINLSSTLAGVPPLNFGNHMTANGWNLSLQQNPAHWFGLVFDISGMYNRKDLNLAPLLSTPPPAGTTVILRLKPSLYTFTGGPQFTYRKSSRIQPFGRVLLGLAYMRANANELVNDVPQFSPEVSVHDTAFDFTAGGGLDYHFQDHVAARVSADYIRTYLQSLTQNNLRVSVGFSYRWMSSPGF